MAERPVRDGPAVDPIQRGLRLPQLRLLVAVAEAGQISGAAAQVGITQPAASRMLTDLEHAAGARLYERHPRGVVLTQAGQLLARRARAALSDLERAFGEMEALSQGTGGLVRVGTVTGPGLELVLPLIRDMRVTYPDIAFEVTVGTSDVLADALFAHRIDFYLGRVLGNVDARDVTIDDVGLEPVALIVRRDHPLLRRPDATLADALVHDWVMQPAGALMRVSVEGYLLRHGLSPPARVVSTSSLLLTLGILSDTNAVAPVARSVAEVLISPARVGGNVGILDLAPGMAVAPYGLICRRDTDHTPVVARILSLLRQRIAARQPERG